MPKATDRRWQSPICRLKRMCRPCDIVISVLQFLVISSCASPNLSVKPNNVQQQPASDVCIAYRLRRIACDKTIEDCCVSWCGVGNKLRVSCQKKSILFPHATCWFFFGVCMLRWCCPLFYLKLFQNNLTKQNLGTHNWFFVSYAFLLSRVARAGLSSFFDETCPTQLRSRTPVSF